MSCGLIVGSLPISEICTRKSGSSVLLRSRLRRARAIEETELHMAKTKVRSRDAIDGLIRSETTPYFPCSCLQFPQTAARTLARHDFDVDREVHKISHASSLHTSLSTYDGRRIYTTIHKSFIAAPMTTASLPRRDVSLPCNPRITIQ